MAKPIHPPTHPRRQFEIPLQVAIGGKIIASETIKAFMSILDTSD